MLGEQYAIDLILGSFGHVVGAYSRDDHVDLFLADNLALESRQRHENLIILIGPGRRPTFRADYTDDLQLHVVNANALADRIGPVGKEFLAHSLAEDAHGGHLLDVVVGHETAGGN